MRPVFHLTCGSPPLLSGSARPCRGGEDLCLQGHGLEAAGARLRPLRRLPAARPRGPALHVAEELPGGPVAGGPGGIRGACVRGQCSQRRPPKATRSAARCPASPIRAESCSDGSHANSGGRAPAPASSLRHGAAPGRAGPGGALPARPRICHGAPRGTGQEARGAAGRAPGSLWHPRRRGPGRQQGRGSRQTGARPGVLRSEGDTGERGPVRGHGVAC
jgi:hypothetical protein